MASWYLLSSIGIYQLAPGNTTYQLGSPMYAHVTLEMDNGNTLDVVAPGNNPTTPYVCSATFNGRALPGLTIDYFDLRKGGELRFKMSEVPCFE